MRQDYADEIKKVIDKLRVINEAPEYSDEELPLGSIAKISSEELKLYYNHFGTIDGVIEIFREKNSDTFVAGSYFGDGDLINIISLTAHKHQYPVTPTQLNPDNVQVKYIMVAEDFARQGLTTAVYDYIASKVDLVSDFIQYKTSKKLWQSLAKSSRVYVYVFDGAIGDYVRDNAGKIIIYNGININETDIWGGPEKQSVLLVASGKPKQ
jgi:hypothetical protein